MRGVQILGNLVIWAIFRAPAAREEKMLIFALRNHHFVFKNLKIFARLRRAKRKMLIFALRNHHFVFKNLKIFGAPAAREKYYFYP